MKAVHWKEQGSFKESLSLHQYFSTRSLVAQFTLAHLKSSLYYVILY